MRVELNPYKKSTTFEANVSKNFEEQMRYYINAHQNRLKNNYRLNKQIENIGQCGYNKYTLDLVKKVKGWTAEYSLVAIKDGVQSEKGIVLTRRGTFKQIMEVFLNLDKKQLRRMFGKSIYS